jgi:site-specific recombinase XerD
MTLSEAFDLWTRELLYLRGRSQRTIRSYRQAFTSLQNYLAAQGLPGQRPGDVPAQVTRQDLNGWVVSMRQRGLSPGACNVYIRAANSFLTWLQEEGHLPERLRVRKLPSPPRPIRPLSDAEAARLLSLRVAGRGRARAQMLACLLMDTGVRIEEAIRLRWPDVDFDQLAALVRGKGNRERRVPFSLELRKRLFKHLKGKEQAGFVFATRGPGPLSYRNAYRDLKALCALAGLEGKHVHPHAFRHFFAVSYVRNGGDLYRLSRILGHSSLATTQLYLRSMGVEILGENHSSLSPLARLRT